MYTHRYLLHFPLICTFSSFSQDEITEKINTFRTTLLGKQKSGTEYDEFGRPM